MRAKAKFISVKETTISFMEFVKLFSTEYKAFRYLEKIRWGETGIVCPFCGEKITYPCNTYKQLISREGDNLLKRAA